MDQPRPELTSESDARGGRGAASEGGRPLLRTTSRARVAATLLAAASLWTVLPWFGTYWCLSLPALAVSSGRLVDSGELVVMADANTKSEGVDDPRLIAARYILTTLAPSAEKRDEYIGLAGCLVTGVVGIWVLYAVGTTRWRSRAREARSGSMICWAAAVAAAVLCVLRERILTPDFGQRLSVAVKDGAVALSPHAGSPDVLRTELLSRPEWAGGLVCACVVWMTLSLLLAHIAHGLGPDGGTSPSRQTLPP